ncbi:hypothetical protein CO154_01330 [Candidatus Pacearchaeota archaeon CG_4_9_14_3_um_filter_31_7]|nr:MAG: hypothetical protein COU55_01110 [Candidatus Pacearchaeota archaeon CG10_big_fil_rev_8_21_14_0_10_31_59]PIZ81127.1 MAG: hypothetical protein COX99_00585 [Candidatus Pacearchaeota archaeon CG_4_10_14_0_2_um_filter_31_10]PJA70701.1 MAG: hypothetical protein CO154_01330 [Candidatus Pacearchaeota archaeon CG_4_9_14_3_um_filter_31_7]
MGSGLFEIPLRIYDALEQRKDYKRKIEEKNPELAHKTREYCILKPFYFIRNQLHLLMKNFAEKGEANFRKKEKRIKAPDRT